MNRLFICAYLVTHFNMATDTRAIDNSCPGLATRGDTDCVSHGFP